MSKNNSIMAGKVILHEIIQDGVTLRLIDINDSITHIAKKVREHENLGYVTDVKVSEFGYLFYAGKSTAI